MIAIFIVPISGNKIDLDKNAEFENIVPNEIIIKFKEGITKDKIKSFNSAYDLSMISESSQSGFHRLKVPTEKTVSAMVKKLSNNLFVEYAEPNYIAKIAMAPNDPYFSYQWHMLSITDGGINIQPAWDIATGTGVTVAVIDTGISTAGNDLAGTCFVSGYDFVNNDNDPNDDNGHGTHVAGTIAQTTNNGIGVCGVAFDACLMPVKVLNSGGTGTYADIIDGINYATSNGADIISISIEGSVPSQGLEDALANAYNNGVTVVAASGNSGQNGVAYPAAYDAYVIAVGATRYDKTRSYYSNYGNSLDLVAPGGDVNVDQNGDSYADGVLQETFDPDWGYHFWQGTSMATPHVSGLAALLFSNGVTSPDDIRTAMQNTAVDLGSTGWDIYYGYGLIDAYSALTYNNNIPPTCTITANPTTGEVPLNTTFSMSASDSDGTISFWELDVDNDDTAEYSGSGNPPSTQEHTYSNSGTYIAELSVWDNEGSIGTDTETIIVTEPNYPPDAPSNLLVQHYGVSSVDDLSSSTTINQGTEIYDYTNTHNQDDSYHQITEIYIGGPPNRGKYSLDIVYPISITGGSGPYTLFLDAYRSDNEAYEISYQVNGAGFSSLGQLIAGSDTDTYLSWALSGVSAGDVVDIRFIDTQEGVGETMGTLYVDHLYIQSSGSGGETDDNKLTWDACTDDGAGADDVTNYNVYRSPDDSSWSYIGLVTANNYATYSYIDSGAGTADGTLWWYKVTAEDIGGLESADSNSAQEPSSSNVPPTADFTYSATDLTVDFTDSSTDPDGIIVSWYWDFGDGNTATIQNPSHTYAADGTYTVTLTVADDDTATDTTSQSVTVSTGGGADSYMYVSDISWSSAGPHLKSIVTIKEDSGGFVSGATVYYTLTNQNTGDSKGFTGVTDSNGQIEFMWKRAPSGYYEGIVTSITHITYIYDSTLDLDNPDYYTH